MTRTFLQVQKTIAGIITLIDRNNLYETLYYLHEMVIYHDIKND